MEAVKLATVGIIGRLNSDSRQQSKSSGSVEKLLSEAAGQCGGMDKAIFVELIKYLWAVTGRKDPPGEVLLLGWYVALRDVTESQLVSGIDRYVRERSSDYPTPQLIRELSGVQNTGDGEAVGAWNAVLQAIKFYGGYQTPKWTGRNDAARITQAIAHLGGWVRLCDTESEELHKWTRQNFMKAYSAIPATAERVRLTNLIELENARTGQAEAAAEVQRRIELRQEDAVLPQAAMFRRDIK